MRAETMSFKVLSLLRGCSKAVAAPSVIGRLPILRRLCPGLQISKADALRWTRLISGTSAFRGAAFLTADFPLWEPGGVAAAKACAQAGVEPILASSPSSLGSHLSSVRRLQDLPERWFSGFRVVHGEMLP